MKTIHGPNLVPAVLAAALLMLLGACGGGGGGGGDSSTNSVPAFAPALQMGFPATITGNSGGGGPASLSAASLSATSLSLGNSDEDFRAAHDGGPHCDFDGQNENDPFRNGFTMTRFLAGHTAAWICFADFLNLVVAQGIFFGWITPDGSFLDITDPMDPTGPTGLVVLDSGTKKEVWLYFLGNMAPNAAIYVAWNVGASSTEGKLVVNVANLMAPPPGNLAADPEAPTHMRMDFTFTDTAKTAEMFLAFDPDNNLAWDNPWADGFRIQAVKTLSDGSFDLWGFMALKQQFDSLYAAAYPGDNGLANLNMLAVSDAAGKGAAIAQMDDIGVVLAYEVNPAPFAVLESLGDFLFTKNDEYYFLSSGTAEFIKKNVVSATYKGGKDLAGGASPIDTDAQVDAALGLAGEYANCTAAPGTTTDCPAVLNALFAGGSFGAEGNIGGATPPADSRQPELAGMTPLNQAFPTGLNSWAGVFNMTFTPTN